jgi:hypothetical protein
MEDLGKNSVQDLGFRTLVDVGECPACLEEADKGAVIWERLHDGKDQLDWQALEL